MILMVYGDCEYVLVILGSSVKHFLLTPSSTVSVLNWRGLLPFPDNVIPLPSFPVGMMVMVMMVMMIVILSYLLGGLSEIWGYGGLVCQIHIERELGYMKWIGM